MGLGNFLKKATGIQAYQDRKEAHRINEDAELRYSKAKEKTEQLKKQLNIIINDFGKVRLETLKSTVGYFIKALNEINQKSKISQYETLESINIEPHTIEEFKTLDMNASQILKTTLASSAIGAVALTGVPSVVGLSVSALATASTGTAISTLSGAAASNAILAWLGGGSLAAGGGGMATGTIVLGTLTYGATAGLAVLAAGFIASAHYSKKLTEATEREKNVSIEIKNMEKSWIEMDGIIKRINELNELTVNLSKRAINEIIYFDPLIPDYDIDDIYHVESFQKLALLIKAIAEVSKVPVFENSGKLSKESASIQYKVKKILENEITN